MTLAVLEGSARWHVETGDAIDLLRAMPAASVDAIVTDPVWPNAPPDMFPGVDAQATFDAAAAEFDRLSDRAVVVIGCDSDPRFLRAVRLPFWRVCWLRRTPPTYKGTLLYSADVAYVFGRRTPNAGRTVVPGETQMVSGGDRARLVGHPCPRNDRAMSWLIEHFTRPGGVVLDPFAGSGTTGVAALRAGRRFIGCEIDPSYAEMARERLAAEADGSTLAASRAGQGALFAPAGRAGGEG